MAADNINIQVDAAKLRSLAESIDKVQSGLRESCYTAKGQIDGLKNIWTGEAASSFQTGFQRLMDGCNQSLEILGKMVNSLYDSADKYDKTLKAVKDDVKNIPKLPTNLFQ